MPTRPAGRAVPGHRRPVARWVTVIGLANIAVLLGVAFALLARTGGTAPGPTPGPTTASALPTAPVTRPAPGDPGGVDPAGALGGLSSAPCPAVGVASPPRRADPQTGLKPLLGGIVAIESAPDQADLMGALGGVSVSVPWRVLQPVDEDALGDTSQVDRAIAAVRAWSTRCDRDIGLRVRVLAGISAPPWAVEAAGAPVLVKDPVDGKEGAAARFWTPSFGRAYDRLQRLLAARYDDVPEVREVSVSRCTTVYAEPFIRQASDASTVASLRDAGYTDELDQACQQSALEAHRVWQHTRSGYALNPAALFDGPGGAAGRRSAEVPLAAAATCRRLLAQRCVLENNSVRWPLQTGPYTDLYAGMTELGPPLAFQTAGPKRVGNLALAVRWAAEVGASSVETSPTGLAALTGVDGASSLALLRQAAGTG